MIAADRPGASLLDLLDGAEAVILIDAVRSESPPGRIHELGLDELDSAPAHFVSSHDLDVVSAIQLARALGRLPKRGRVIGLEIKPGHASGLNGLSASIGKEMHLLLERVRSWAAAFDNRVRERLLVAGTVQGVGMRPFVWRLAESMDLGGLVRNVPAGLEIEIEGGRDRVREFRRRMMDERPAAAVIEDVEVERLPVTDRREFRAMPSERGRTATTIPPDLAICNDCSGEILDPENRRYRYPFINCTACGPRFTVVRALPYDRATTTLSEFQLCDQCAREYLDPSDRRFRAEPIACSRCGPRAWLESCRSGRGAPSSDTDCIADAAAILRSGGIVAVLGVGGAHLACDAANDEAVARLRAVKRRPFKPLAVMVDSIDSARRFAIVSDEEAHLLASPSAPIVLLRKRTESGLASSIAPNNDHVGIMLAYSPLHLLLVRDAGGPLVMTSANRPGAPLARDASEIRATFAAEVDAMLLHDRPIHQRCDDSVWIAGPKGSQPIRLSRGYTPRSLKVPVAARAPILGVGGDIKNNFCMLSGSTALMSQYVGTLENLGTREHFRDSLEKWIAMSGVRPAIAVHDLHPQSVARSIAEELRMQTLAVQHHHAHIASCAADNGHDGPVIGIAFDGAGYGPDGCIWGGEAMVADYEGFRRLSHLEYLPLAGGDAALRHPGRIAAAFLLGSFGPIFSGLAATLAGEENARIIARMIERGINTFQTSSCGRLFDAVAALLGVCGRTTYEAQAAIELETLARSSAPVKHVYPFSLRDGVMRTNRILAAIIADLEHRTPVEKIARAFHETIAAAAASMAVHARAETGIRTVALSGGCFQNRLLLAATIERMEERGFTVLAHRRVPANDGGLALGQAAIAAVQTASGGSQCVSAFRAE